MLKILNKLVAVLSILAAVALTVFLVIGTVVLWMAAHTVVEYSLVSFITSAILAMGVYAVRELYVYYFGE